MNGAPVSNHSSLFFTVFLDFPLQIGYNISVKARRILWTSSTH